MGKTVDETVRFAGQFQSVVTALQERCAPSGVQVAEAVPLLAQPENASALDAIARVLVGVVDAARNIMSFIFAPSPFQTFVDWELVEDMEFHGGELTLEAAEFLRDYETDVDGEEMRRLAIAMGATGGQRFAEFLLRNQHLIPAGFRGYWLVFPGTIRRILGMGRHIPYLYWSGDRWVMFWRSIGGGWPRRCRVLRPRA